MEGSDVKYNLEAAVDAQIIYNKITQIHDKWQSESSEECSRELFKEMFDLLEMRGKELKNDEDYDVLIQRLLNIKCVFINSSKRNVMLYILLLEWATYNLCLKVPNAHEKLVNMERYCYNAFDVFDDTRLHFKSQDRNFPLIITQRLRSLYLWLHEHIMEVSIPPSLETFRDCVAGNNLAKMSRCYLELSDLGKTLNFAKRGIALMKNSFGDDANRYCAVSVCHYLSGVVYFKTADYVAAARELKTSIQASKESTDNTDYYQRLSIDCGEILLRESQISQYHDI